MSLPASHVVPVLLALCFAGAMAYYDRGDLDTITDEEESPYRLRRVADEEVRQQGGRWEPAPDPRFYVLTEGAGGGGGGGQDYDDNERLQTKRVKRNSGPSLSIVNSLDVLRQRLLLEIARRRMRQSEDQILANREMLDKIGKRDVGSLSVRRGAMSHWGRAARDSAADQDHDVRTS